MARWRYFHPVGAGTSFESDSTGSTIQAPNVPEVPQVPRAGEPSTTTEGASEQREESQAKVSSDEHNPENQPTK
jgi:hypothetical protein